MPPYKMTTKKCQYEENKISGWGKTSCPRARRKAVFTLVIEAIDTRNAATFVFATKQVNLARKLLLEAKEQYHDINSISAWRISDKQSSENWEKEHLPSVSLWYFDACWVSTHFNTIVSKQRSQLFPIPIRAFVHIISQEEMRCPAGLDEGVENVV